MGAFGRFRKASGFVYGVVISTANRNQKDLADQRLRAYGVVENSISSRLHARTIT